MPREPQPLGEFEQMVLLAVLRAGAEAYGVSVHDELERHGSRRIARGAVYMTLDRLEKKGLLTSTVGEPTPERGGRAKRCYRLTRTATRALRASRRTLLSLWDGLEPLLEK
jgi:DNA-binding PadR family transcriptional regulator